MEQDESFKSVMSWERDWFRRVQYTSDPSQYSGDDVICTTLGEALKQARLESGFSIEEAEERLRAVIGQRDRKRFFRALGLAIKEAREQRHVSRKELSHNAGLVLRRLILLERGLTGELPITEFVRISFALKMRPDVLAERCEEIEKSIVQRAHEGE